jgi:hypothetical protein
MTFRPKTWRSFCLYLHLRYDICLKGRRRELSREEGSRISGSRSLWRRDTQWPNQTVSFEPGALRRRKANIAAHGIRKWQKWQPHAIAPNFLTSCLSALSSLEFIFWSWLIGNRDSRAISWEIVELQPLFSSEQFRRDNVDFSESSVYPFKYRSAFPYFHEYRIYFSKCNLFVAIMIRPPEDFPCAFVDGIASIYECMRQSPLLSSGVHLSSGYIFRVWILRKIK